jgi:hypothetical protein
MGMIDRKKYQLPKLDVKPKYIENAKTVSEAIELLRHAGFSSREMGNFLEDNNITFS